MINYAVRIQTLNAFYVSIQCLLIHKKKIISCVIKIQKLVFIINFKCIKKFILFALLKKIQLENESEVLYFMKISKNNIFSDNFHKGYCFTYDFHFRSCYRYMGVISYLHSNDKCAIAPVIVNVNPF